jgi:outer membrane protein assembly factor BamA
LYKSNFFENIEVSERDGDTGKIITFTVKEKPLIREIKYEGNKSFTESNILEQFKNRTCRLRPQMNSSPVQALQSGRWPICRQSRRGGEGRPQDRHLVAGGGGI